MYIKYIFKKYNMYDNYITKYITIFKKKKKKKKKFSIFNKNNKLKI